VFSVGYKLKCLCIIGVKVTLQITEVMYCNASYYTSLNLRNLIPFVLLRTLAQEVTFREVPCSNLDRYTGYTDRDVRYIRQSLQVDASTVAPVRTRPVSSTSCAMSYSTSCSYSTLYGQSSNYCQRRYINYK
jgi:hypothetical protein